MNLHSKVLFKLMKKGVSEFHQTPAYEIPAPSAKEGVNLKTIDLSYVAPNLIIPKKDEDVAGRSQFFRNIINWNNRYNPLKDPDRQWESPEEGQEELKKRFGNYLPASRVDWRGYDPTGNRVLKWWAFSGFGAIELRKLSSSESEKEFQKGGKPVFVSGYEFLGKFEVRKNLLPYGGNCYFSESGKILKIKLHGKDFFPNEGSDWEFAKFAYRSSSVFWATVYHHLFVSHYNVSNISSLATYKNLAPGHPLRNFLKPFIFRTAAINSNSCDTLLPEGSIIHRASALTWSGMQDVYKFMKENYSFNSFPERLKARGFDSKLLGNEQYDLFAYRKDGLAFWNSIHEFIGDIVENSSLFKKPIVDDSVKKWWEEISDLSGESLGGLTHSNLTAYLTDFLFSVSGFHSFVGHVTPYIENPKILSTKLFPGRVIADRQTSEQISIVASLTGLPIPKLLENFTHLMPDTDLARRVQHFSHKLLDLNTEIKNRNARRDIPVHAFLPEVMGLSVSI